MGLNDMPSLYQAVVNAAVADGHSLMAALLQATRRGFYERAALALTHQSSQTLKEAELYLDRHESVMVERFPSSLQSVISTARSDGAGRSTAPVQFDQLELMDETQVLEQVALGRAQQAILPVVERSFASLAPLMTVVSGPAAVPTNQNPLRPDLYIRAVLMTVNQMCLPGAVHQEWMTGLTTALGPALSAQYTRLALSLLDQGVKPWRSSQSMAPQGFSDSGLQEAGVLSPMAGMEHDASAQAAGPKPISGPSTLTLNRLRMLLSGELTAQQPDSRVALFAQKFSLEFDDANRSASLDHTDFDVTVPAAFEALQEMKQVDQVMQRIGDRNAAGLSPPQGVSTLDKNGAKTQLSSRDLGQALSLEVVSLMIDNMVNGPHVLSPVKAIIRMLEPALLCLAERDPRFFSNKQHPARRLLEEITQRSLAYESVHQLGFDDFMVSLRATIAPLLNQLDGNPQPFEAAVERLILVLNEAKKPEKVMQAVHALQRADERHRKAMKIASSIRSRSATLKVPIEVIDFLCGPWAQVLAHAHLENPSGATDPGRYGELVEALLWSVRPELTRKDPAKLTRLLPKLLDKLRQGLSLIDYPPMQSSTFFAFLMGVHQQGLRPVARAVRPADAPTPVKLRPVLPVATNEDEESDPWLAPQEAQASGFMALAPAQSSTPASPDGRGQIGEQLPKTLSDGEFPVGVWVEIFHDKVWTRVQLTWTNPKGNMFLFTSAAGATQSMTRRSRDQMLLANTMRLVSGQHVVDDALNAIAQTALHNSIDFMS